MNIPVYDIETLGWVNPVAVGFYSGEDYFEFLKMADDHDPVWEFLQFIRENYPSIKLYAHNAVHFDNKFILQTLTQHKEKVAFNAGIARLTWDEPNIDFEDSFLVLGRSLNNCCKAFGIPQKLSWDHDQTQNPWEMRARLDEFRAYLKRDCISLSHAMGEYTKTLIDEFGVVPSMTMSLTSAKIFDKCFFPVKKIDANEQCEPFIRAATYGGRNEVFHRYGQGIYFYDIISMYVSCYDVPVPIGRLQWTVPDIDKPTLAEAIVKVPQMMIGPLPYRYNVPGTGDVRLIFPVGEFKGWWDTRELKKATKKGVDVKLIRQLQADEEPILKPFGKKIMDLRYKSKNIELSRIWKLHGVRLSGKFGQHRFMTETAHCLDIEDFNGWVPIDEQEIYHERLISLNGRRSPYIKPAVNMRIRAEARIRHNELLTHAKNRGTLYYCDNDSVICDIPMYTGKRAGQLQMIDHATEAWFVRPKFYGYENDMGHMRLKTSGYHDYKVTRYDFEKLLQGGEIAANHFKSISHWKDSLTEAGVRLVDRKRSVRTSRDFENRIVNGLETEPIRLEMHDGEVIVPYIKSQIVN